MNTSEPLRRYVGQTDPPIDDVISVDGTAQDISAATKKFWLRALGGTTLTVNGATATHTTDGTDGGIRYTLQASDVDTAGLYLGWWTVDGLVKGEFLMEIREHGPSAGALVELAEVRLAIGIPDSDTSQDARILELIATASREIQDEVDRELYPVGTATRRRGALNRIVSLSPWDLLSATTVTLDPDGDAQTLVANTDYKLTPIGGSDILGTYTELVLDSSLSLNSLDCVTRFGRIEVQIAGTWGPAAVPRAAKEATITTVRAWLRRDAGQYAGFDTDPAGGGPVEPGGFYGIPPAARNQLRPLYRFPKGHGFA